MKTYLLRSHDEYGFYTGRTPDGQQVIAGWDWNAFLTLYFSPQGALLQVTTQAFDAQGELTDSLVTAAPLELSREARATLQAHFERWLSGIMIAQEPVRVQKFSVDGRFMSIEDMPAEWQEFLDDPSTAINEEDANEMAEQIEDWRSGNHFVFWWNNDYWVDGDTGEVTDS